jgi:hypothetical protein
MKKILLLFGMLCAFTWQAAAQGFRYDSRVTTVSSSTPFGANSPVLAVFQPKVRICTSAGCPNLAAIYSDSSLTVPVSNPMTGNTAGEFGFWAAGGNYFKEIRTSGGTLIGIYPFSLGGTGGGGATFPNTNNVVFNTSTLASRSATFADIVGLWSTCTGLLKSDGTCPAPLSLTTTGSSGVATLTGSTLNIPNYAVGTGITGLTTGYVPQATSSTSVGNSFIDYAVSNAGAYTSTKDIYAPSFHGTGSGPAGFTGPENTAISGSAGVDALWADSTAHGFMMNNNNTGAVRVAGTIASGSTALGTSAIASGACATVVTAAATGVVSTDAIAWNPNGSIKAVTGYVPATTGGLSIAVYPTANTLNIDVCNWSNASITPGAVTINWRIAR